MEWEMESFTVDGAKSYWSSARFELCTAVQITSDNQEAIEKFIKHHADGQFDISPIYQELNKTLSLVMNGSPITLAQGMWLVSGPSFRIKSFSDEVFKKEYQPR